MSSIAMVVGTLFWFTLFLGFMVTFYVLTKGGFGGKALVEAAIALGLMVGVGVPLSFLARKLSGRVVNAAEREAGTSDEESKGSKTTRRVNRRQG